MMKNHKTWMGITGVFIWGISIFSYAQEIPSSLALPEAQPMEAYQVMKNQYDQDIGYHDQASVGKMTLITSGGNTEREFIYSQLEKTATDGAKAMVKIRRPPELQGMALLSYTHPDRADDQWIYLAAQKKTKRITGSGKSGSFIGSEFNFEDLTPTSLDGYDYRFLGQELCGNVTCYQIESHPKALDSIYSKLLLWIQNDNYQTVRIDLYDKSGSLVKRATFDDLRLLNGKYWRPFKMSMKNLSNGNETQLLLEDCRIQSGLTEADFSRVAMER